ncbi:hypothetical protein [Sphingomonas oryzagri]|uniref:hypothetical protein n=1 Tax=Sphingomonas oryzagri TaxID=3042314 RepID=UPI00247A73EF|nr:hypothetical protein [Sphingomonas oryzagri]
MTDRAEDHAGFAMDPPTPVLDGSALEQSARTYRRCVEIADQAVPKYRGGKRSYSCGGQMAKRWAAAFDAAMIALSGAKA